MSGDSRLMLADLEHSSHSGGMQKKRIAALMGVLCLSSNVALLDLHADTANDTESTAKVEKKADPESKEAKPEPKPAAKSVPPKPVVKPTPAPMPKAAPTAPEPKQQPEKTKPVVDPEAAAAALVKDLAAELEAAIKAKDFPKVEKIGKAIGSEGRSNQSHVRGGDWSALLSRYSEAQSLLLESYLVHRLDEVAEFAERVSKACLEGKSVRELEMLEIEAIGLSVESSVFRHQGGNSGPWRERLDSAKKLLQAWIRIQNLIDQGYDERAASQIEYFVKSSSEYPIIALKDLDELVAGLKGAKKMEEVSPAKVIEGKLLGAMRDHLDGVDKPSAVVFTNLAAAIGELAPMAAKVPPFSQDVRELMRGFYGLAGVRDMLDSGNVLQASYDLPDSNEVREFAPGYYLDSRNTLAVEIVQKQFPELSKEMSPTENEKLETYLFRLLVSPEAKKAPETRLRLLRALISMGYRGRDLPDSLKQIHERHEAFVKAETELRVGSVQSAIRYYRRAAYDPEDEFGLATLAESRIADIKDQSPEALAEFDEKMVNQMKALRSAVNTMAKELATLKATIEAPK